MVDVDVGVSQGVDKVAGLHKRRRCEDKDAQGGVFDRGEGADLQPRDVCNHVCEQRVAGDVEGHPQAHISRPLVELAGQLAVAHVELAKGVAGGQGHEGQVCKETRD